MEEVIKFLTENPQQYLATTGLDGNAKVRPILFYFAEDNKPYFCTSNQKPMYKELEANPNFEMTAATPEFQWIRIAGKVEFVALPLAIVNTSKIGLSPDRKSVV